MSKSESEKSEKIERIRALIDKDFISVSLGVTLNILNENNDLDEEDLDNIIESLENVLRYKSKLKMSGISIEFTGRCKNNRIIPSIDNIVSDKSVDDEPITIDCAAINHGNVDVSATMMISGIKTDIRGLNLDIQSESVIKALCSFMVPYNLENEFSYNRFMDFLIYDEDTIDKMVRKVTDIVDAEMNNEGRKNDKKLILFVETMVKLLWSRITYGCNILENGKWKKFYLGSDTTYVIKHLLSILDLSSGMIRDTKYYYRFDEIVAVLKEIISERVKEMPVGNELVYTNKYKDKIHELREILEDFEK